MGKVSRKDDRLTTTQSFIAGGLAGVISRSLTSPLDVVKILAQVGVPEARLGFVRSFTQLYQSQGLAAFWKGNSVACLRLFPYNAIQFGTYSKIKRMFQDPVTGKITSLNSLIAGSVAGVFATALTYPADMLKTRLTLNNISHVERKYPRLPVAFQMILREEGAQAFFKGFVPSVLGVIPFAGTLYFTYESLDAYSSKPRDRLTPVEGFVNGCIAAAVAQTFSFPFDTIRKKMQAQSAYVPWEMRPDVKFNGMVDCFMQTVKTNGVIGLWRGNAANLVKIVPFAGIMFASFEVFKRGFVFQNGYTVSPWSDVSRPGIDQKMTPEEVKKWLWENKDKAKNEL